jgi:hypothetical protein
MAMFMKHARSKTELVNHLRQLVDALDRRVPHVERDGEKKIATEAHALKELALRRLEELEAEASGTVPHALDRPIATTLQPTDAAEGSAVVKD